MKSYDEFCKHYEYDKNSEEAKKLYDEYKNNFNIFKRIMKK